MTNNDEPRTLKEMAAFIASVENRANDENRILQQLRGAADRRLLKHRDTNGPKAAKRFQVEQMFAGRILMAALAAGIESNGLADISNDAQIETRDLLPDGTHVTYSRAAALKSLADPSQLTKWELTVFHAFNADTRKRLYVTLWKRDGSFHRDPDFYYEAETTIPVSRIVERMMDDLSDTERAELRALES